MRPEVSEDLVLIWGAEDESVPAIDAAAMRRPLLVRLADEPDDGVRVWLASTARAVDAQDVIIT